jgi:hypothetical protein
MVCIIRLSTICGWQEKLGSGFHESLQTISLLESQKLYHKGHSKATLSFTTISSICWTQPLGSGRQYMTGLQLIRKSKEVISQRGKRNIVVKITGKIVKL